MNYEEYAGLARALFEGSASPQLLCESDGGKILDANAASQALCGFSLRQLLDVPLAELVRAADGRPWSPPRRRRAAGGAPPESACLLRTFRAGFSLPVTVSVARLGVRPRSLALLTLRRADPAGAGGRPPTAARLRRLLAAAPVCLWGARATRRGAVRNLYLSPAVERITGRPPDYFGRDLARWRELVCPADRAAWEHAWESRLRGQATEEQYRVVRPDGGLRWVRDCARAERSPDGRFVWLFGVFTDVTDRRHDEAHLRHLADLVETAGDAIISQALDGSVVVWNRGAEELFGYSKGEMSEKRVLRLFEPDGAPRFTDAVRRARHGERVEPYEARQVRRGGGRVSTSVRVSPVTSPSGELQAVSIIARRTPEVERAVPEPHLVPSVEALGGQPE
jgi:PAS domain S-box-containing protein